MLCAFFGDLFKNILFVDDPSNSSSTISSPGTREGRYDLCYNYNELTHSKPITFHYSAANLKLG